MNKIEKFIKECPKAELHFHIDNISPELYLKFVKRNHMNVPFQTVEEVKNYYTFSTLNEFIEKMLASIKAIQTEEDFKDMVIECAKDMKRQNIIYRECMFDYTGCYQKRGIALETLVNGFYEGLKVVNHLYDDLDIRFIANIDRTDSAENNLQYLNELVKYKDKIPLIAIGMDMAEIGYPASHQKEVFEKAKEYGFHLTGHNGEDVGAESVWDALKSCHLERIDHGVRSVEDGELLKYEKEKNVLLTLCPDSNISLGVYPSWQDYPLRKIMESGVKVCINSDDPGILTYDLVGNLIKCAEIFQLTEKEIIELIRNAFVYNFAGNEHISKVDEWLQKNNVK